MVLLKLFETNLSSPAAVGGGREMNPWGVDGTPATHARWSNPAVGQRGQRDVAQLGVEQVDVVDAQYTAVGLGHSSPHEESFDHPLQPLAPPPPQSLRAHARPSRQSSIALFGMVWVCWEVDFLPLLLNN